MTDVDEGIFDAVAEHNRDIPALQETQKQREADQAETKTQTETEDAEEAVDTQDYSREPRTESDADAETQGEESKDETEEEQSQEPSKQTDKTETEDKDKTESTDVDWKTTLPPPPVFDNIKEPELNEEGQITNMTPAEYEDYLISKAEQRFQQKAYDNYVENAALDAAEQILPDIKTNPALRQIIESMRIASVVDGTQIDAVQAAKEVKKLLGGATAEGAQNAKTSIEIQKNVALETGAGSRQVDNTSTDQLNKRLKRNEPGAFEELMDMWQEEGKV